ncbi:MAG: hypothetical protein LQ339_005487 [Xanthoria mediterranea]|nr:MAG: hypothetical protein LQ339_005487 [Xanthoria mediterranea]
MAFLRSMTILCTAALLCHSTAAAASPSKDGSDTVNQQVSDSSQANHPYFGIRIHPRASIPINSLSMLVNALDALTAIGLTDHRTRSPPMRFDAPGNPHVIIDVNPKRPATTILNELATLCIYYGVADLAGRRQYTEAVFDCLWDNVDVAEVIISNRGRLATVTNTTTATTGALNGLGDEFQPQFFYFENAKNIDLATAFITAMNSIRSFSPRGHTEVLTGYIYTDPGPRWDASMVFPDTSRPLRRQPPYLEYRYVIYSMRLALIYMFERGRIAELGITFRIDGVFLGSALLIKGKPDRETGGTLDKITATA